MVEEHQRQLVERRQPLPTELVDPTLQVIQHGAFVVVGPQAVQTLFEEVSFEYLSVQREELIQFLSLCRPRGSSTDSAAANVSLSPDRAFGPPCGRTRPAALRQWLCWRVA